jgi:hypothetical protein
VSISHHIHAFSVPKYGHKERENEDAVAFDAQAGWLAVADGATEASYSREWAEILAESISTATKKPGNIKERMLERLIPSRRLGSMVADLQQKWYDQVPWDRLEDLGWLFVEKAQQGALATFLAVRIEEQKWAAIGIGDCNLFIVGKNGIVKLSVPAETADEFGTSPSLVPSMPGPQVKQALSSLWRKTGKWQPDESLIVCTDAVAAYLLYAVEKDASIMERLLAIETTKEFAHWVQGARSTGMRNDDATVALVTQA